MAKGQAKRLAELNGAPPRLASAEDLEAAGPRTGRSHATKKSAITSPSPHRINLKAVAEALVEEGLDPTVEMIRIMKAQRPVVTVTGKPVIDPKTKKQLMADVLDPDTKLRMLNELLQYTQPKLKSVEMKVSGALELTGEQLDTRLTALLRKAAGAKR
jgi:hypothetical protein